MPSINDKSDWKTVKNALQVIDIDAINTNVSEDFSLMISFKVNHLNGLANCVQHLFGIVASVLHLGNVKFEPDGKGHATLNNNNAELRGVSNVRNLHTQKNE